MFTRLLVGVDGSSGADIALGTAIELARRFSCTIVLVTVTDPAEGPAEPEHQRGTRVLADAEAKVRAAGVALESIQAAGMVPDMLLALADEAEAVVVGRRGHSHESGANVIGGQTARLVRRSPKPVLIAGESVSVCRRPVVAYDGGETSSSALTFAARYAEAIKVPVDVVHVADEFRAAEELLARAGAYLSGAGVEYTTHRLEGETAAAVTAHVAASGADLLLVGAHSGRRRRSWSIGTKAEKLVGATPMPVILVR